jgi:hypothetical protein
VLRRLARVRLGQEVGRRLHGLAFVARRAVRRRERLQGAEGVDRVAGERVADDRVVVAPLVHEVGDHAGVPNVDDLPGQLLGVVRGARR